MNLKELTWENHKKAERKKFAYVLMSGRIPPVVYHKYLTNQFVMYAALEKQLMDLGFPKELHGVFRAPAILDDMVELQKDVPDVYPVTTEYIQHINKLSTEKNYEGLVAHMYVRHFGDMYGGAMISKKVPGSGTMYQFEDKEGLKASLRELLNDNMGDEANICFDYAIRLFEELGNEPGLGFIDRTAE